jgi:hypothetical protein
MRAGWLVLVVALWGSAVHAQVATLVDMATISMSAPATPRLTSNSICATDGTDLLCDRGAFLLSGGLISTTRISATNISASVGDFTTLRVGGVSITSGGGGAASPTNVPAFSVHRNGVSQTVSNTAYSLITWTTESFDTTNNFSANRFTPNVSGRYMFVLNAYCIDSTVQCAPGIYKNGSLIAQNNSTSIGASYAVGNLITIVDMNGTTDYVEAYVFNQGGTNLGGDGYVTFFQGSLLASGNGLISGSTALGDRITSGTTAMVANSPTGVISLTQLGTATAYLHPTLGYVGPGVSTTGTISATDFFTGGLLTATRVTATNISASNISATTLTAGSAGFGPVAATSMAVSGPISATVISATAIQLVSQSTSPVACTTSNAGSLRYNSPTTTLELCNGVDWVSATGGGGVGVPTGTIAAFESTSCPAGWVEYTPARGRFLRGIDNGAGNDPSGTRVPGNAQTDALQNITGSIYNTYAATGRYGQTGAFVNSSVAAGSTISSPNYTTSAAAAFLDFDASQSPGTRTANETRPNNVAVLFCRYTGSGGEGGGGGSVSPTTPGGSSGQIQFNNAGAFDGSAGLLWDNAASRLTATNISSSAVEVAGTVSATELVLSRVASTCAGAADAGRMNRNPTTGRLQVCVHRP